MLAASVRSHGDWFCRVFPDWLTVFDSIKPSRYCWKAMASCVRSMLEIINKNWQADHERLTQGAVEVLRDRWQVAWFGAQLYATRSPAVDGQRYQMTWNMRFRHLGHPDRAKARHQETENKSIIPPAYRRIRALQLWQRCTHALDNSIVYLSHIFRHVNCQLQNGSVPAKTVRDILVKTIPKVERWYGRQRRCDTHRG